jgi:DNA-binding transcriptional LysR family regulator
MVMYTVKQLAYFAAVAEHGGIAQAARGLHVSQPAIAFSLTKLEETLGLKLLVRHHARGVDLTPNGRHVLKLSHRLLDEAADIDREFAGLSDTMKGRVRLACYETIAPFYMPGMLRWTRAHAPNIVLDVSEGRQDALIGDLVRRKFDLALLYDMGLERRAIGQVRLVSLPPYVLLPERHRLAGHAAIDLRQLAGEPFVMLDWPVTREFYLRIMKQAGLVPKIEFRSPSFELVRGAVANEVGYSVLNARPAGDLSYDGKRLVCRPIKGKLPPLNIVAAWAVKEPPSRLRNRMIELARAYFAEATAPGENSDRRDF